MNVTDQMIAAFGEAWEETEPGAPGDRRRAGIEAVLRLLPENPLDGLTNVEVNNTWVNAFTVVRPSDEQMRELGCIVYDALKASMGRERNTDALEPIGAAVFRFVAS